MAGDILKAARYQRHHVSDERLSALALPHRVPHRKLRR